MQKAFRNWALRAEHFHVDQNFELSDWNQNKEQSVVIKAFMPRSPLSEKFSLLKITQA